MAMLSVYDKRYKPAAKKNEGPEKSDAESIRRTLAAELRMDELKKLEEQRKKG